MRMTRKAFGEKIRSIRVQKGWLQCELATKLDISQPKISKIENGKLEMSAFEFNRFKVLIGKRSIFADLC